MPRHNLSGFTDFTVDAVFDLTRHGRRLKGTTCDVAQATERALSLNTSFPRASFPRVIVRHRPAPARLSVLAMNS